MCHCRSDIAACSQPRGAAWPNLSMIQHVPGSFRKEQQDVSQYAVARGGMAAEPAAAQEGAGMPLTQPGCPPFHLPLSAGLHLHMDCLRVPSPPSPLRLRNDTCLLETVITWTNCLLEVIFPKPGSGETKESAPSTEQLISHYLCHSDPPSSA